MIWESCYWKEPLLEAAERFRSLKVVEEPSEDQLVQLEKDVLVGFYSVRKLFETPTKITDEIKNSKLDVAWYPNVGKHVNWRNNHRLDELYDFSSGGREQRDAWFICSRIMHSFIFAPVVGDAGGLEAILFTSDNDKDKRLYALHIDHLIEFFKSVGNDNPTEIRWERNQVTGEESTVVK
ncbi:hypothetical protein [Marinobacter salicampi]|uniref:hypothetical protein n=1 Tax=Marinobacter salicampi TaxID=435907 RepID=UPI00140918C3|nr:hypothetical protein [Marinobacter salicampi]